MDRQTAIDKIRKCMALASSSEPHEAAAALRQAQKLIEQFGIEHPELLAAGITEDWVKSSAKKTPARYEVSLASMIASTFQCELIFCRQLNFAHTAFDGGYAFIGVAPSPEIGTYAFATLRRQMLKARKTYIANALKRYRKNKIAAADQFCEGWVFAVRRIVGEVAMSDQQAEAVNAYLKINYAHTTALQPTYRSTARSKQKSNGRAVTVETDYAHWAQGHAEGQNAQLHRGVTGVPATTLLGQ